MTEREKIVSLLLRIGVAFAFLYPAISAIFSPFSWIGYFPRVMRDFVANDNLLLHSFGVLEGIIALWILSGKNIFYPSIAAAIMLFAIVFFNWPEMPVIFRDLPIAVTAIALALLNKKNET